MKKMLLIFSHNLTKDQEQDAKINFGIEEFIYLPPDLQNLWSAIPPELDDLNDYLNPIKTYIKDNSKDSEIALIQGDFGATYLLVNLCKDLNIIPVYATTKRITQEKEENGKIIKTSIFKHIKFRKYQ